MAVVGWFLGGNLRSGPCRLDCWRHSYGFLQVHVISVIVVQIASTAGSLSHALSQRINHLCTHYFKLKIILQKKNKQNKRIWEDKNYRLRQRGDWLFARFWRVATRPPRRLHLGRIVSRKCLRLRLLIAGLQWPSRRRNALQSVHRTGIDEWSDLPDGRCRAMVQRDGACKVGVLEDLLLISVERPWRRSGWWA